MWLFHSKILNSSSNVLQCLVDYFEENSPCWLVIFEKEPDLNLKCQILWNFLQRNYFFHLSFDRVDLGRLAGICEVRYPPDQPMIVLSYPFALCFVSNARWSNFDLFFSCWVSWSWFADHYDYDSLCSFCLARLYWNLSCFSCPSPSSLCFDWALGGHFCYRSWSFHGLWLSSW